MISGVSFSARRCIRLQVQLGWGPAGGVLTLSQRNEGGVSAPIAQVIVHLHLDHNRKPRSCLSDVPAPQTTRVSPFSSRHSSLLIVARLGGPACSHRLRTHSIIFLPASRALGSPHFITSNTVFGGDTHDRACVPLRICDRLDQATFSGAAEGSHDDSSSPVSRSNTLDNLPPFPRRNHVGEPSQQIHHVSSTRSDATKVGKDD